MAVLLLLLLLMWLWLCMWRKLMIAVGARVRWALRRLQQVEILAGSR